MKASNITDEMVFAVVDRVRADQGTWTCMWDLWAAFPQFPPKVVQGKMRQMVNKKRIGGCGCGCRGDFERLGPRPATNWHGSRVFISEAHRRVCEALGILQAHPEVDAPAVRQKTTERT